MTKNELIEQYLQFNQTLTELGENLKLLEKEKENLENIKNKIQNLELKQRIEKNLQSYKQVCTNMQTLKTLCDQLIQKLKSILSAEEFVKLMTKKG